MDNLAAYAPIVVLPLVFLLLHFIGEVLCDVDMVVNSGDDDDA